jgi:hypothetical protein
LSLSSKNGLTNGSARRRGEGLTNGSGLVNGTGLVNGNGLINGNGLVNGNGMVNGTGLVNGNGLTNGLSRLPIRRNTFGVVTNKDLRVGLALIMLGLLIIPVVSIYLMEPAYESYDPSITVDGEFSDWDDVPKYVDAPDNPRPDVTVQTYAIDLERNHLSFFVQAVGIVLGDINGYDTYYFFIDSDGDSATGYRLNNFGADFVVEVFGGDNIVKDARVDFFRGDDQGNWSAFAGMEKAEAKASGRMMEVQTTIHSLSLEEDFLVLFCADDHDGGQSCSSVPVGKEPGALLVEQFRFSSVVERQLVTIMEVRFTALASDVTVNDISIMDLGGATIETPQLPFTVAEGTTTTKFITADLTLAPMGALITATVESVLADRPPTIRGEVVRSYIEEIPGDIVIDGFFEDWTTGNPDPMDPSVGANVDMIEHEAIEGTEKAFFHMKVTGEILEGTFAPQMKSKHIPGEPGQPSPPAPITESRVSGEDYLMIYIDTNSSDDVGEAFYGVMADAVVEIRGMYGEIRQASLMTLVDGTWEVVAGIEAEIDADEIEISVQLSRLGTLDDPTMIFVTSSWNRIGDVSLQQTDWQTRSRAIYLVEDDGTGAHVATSLQRKVFYTGSYFFAFYHNAAIGNVTWEWSSDGVDWGNSYDYPFESSDIYYSSVWYNSSDAQVYIVGAKNSAETDVYVRKGSVSTNQITWGTETAVSMSQTGMANKVTSISVSAGGHVWIASSVDNSTGYNVNVTRSTLPEDVSGWDAQTALSTDQVGIPDPVIVPLANDDMYCLFNRNGVIYGHYYDDSATGWDSGTAVVSDAKPRGIGGPSAVVDTSAYVHMVYANTTGVVNYTKYTSSWSATTVLDDGSNSSFTTISLVPSDDVYAFWINGSYQISGRYSTDGGSTWNWMTWITTNTNPKWNLTSVYSYTSEWGIGWLWDMNGDEIYFERIPEFEFLLMPIIAAVFVPILLRRRR